MKKRTVISIIVLIAMLAVVLCLMSLASCTEQTMTVSTGDDGYSVYNGMTEETVTIDDVSTDIIKISVRHISGELQIRVFEDGNENNSIYSGHTFPTEAFTVNATKNGDYRIVIRAKDFCGEYKIQFSSE